VDVVGDSKILYVLKKTTNRFEREDSPLERQRWADGRKMRSEWQRR
jgi:hypothetical protein